MKFKLTTNESFLVNGYVNGQPKEVDVLRDILTISGDSADYADGAEYDSTNKLIYLKHGNTRLSGPIDATAFIKDGMVENATVTVPTSGSHSGQTCLVITFNTDSGKEDIEIPISQIFDASNYYTKTDVDTALSGKQDTLVSGTNIKTVNGTTLLGSGNIDADDVIMGELDGTVFYKATSYTPIPEFSSTPENGSPEKIYVDILANKAYRWNQEAVAFGENRYKLLSEELSVITDSEINASQPGTTKRAVSAEVLLNNFYTETEVDNALALKQNIDDVYVDQAYVDTNTTNSFASDNKRYNIAENITLTTDATYTFGSGCILHFYNAGKLNGAANLALNNTQIEAPLKQCFDLNVNFDGLMRNSECYPEWWGAVGDGETDDAAAINRCIYCACHTPVVLNGENYLVKSTIGPDYKVKNTAANTATHTGWGDTYAAQFIIKHNIIGDATLAGPVVRFAISYGYCNIDGTILVRNTSDDAVGFTTCSSDGTLQCINSNINIGRIDKGTWPLSSLSSDSEGIGLGTGAALIGIWDSTIKIYNVRGFKEGCYLSRFATNDLWVGRNECVYCFYLGTPKTSWNLASSTWYVHRSRMTLGVQFAGLSSEAFVTEAADSAIIKENGSVEIAMNTWVIGDNNNGHANCRHPHKHSLYYISGNGGHTGNKYTFNITYAIETSRKFVKFDVPSSNKGPNGDEINFGVGCFLKDIDIPYAWNVKLHNVILSNTAKTKGTYRWIGGSGEMLVDTVTVTRASTPIFNSGATTIYLLDINPQFKGSAVSVSSAPSTCDNNKFYVVDNPITTNGTKKYPVYYNYFGSGATLIGYTLDNYKDNDPRVPRVNVAGGTVAGVLEPDKLFIFGSATTPCTSLTLTLAPGDSNYAEYYHAVAYCGANMTLSIPNTVTVAENRALPTFGAGDIFEFEILNIGTNKYLMHFSHTPAS